MILCAPCLGPRARSSGQVWLIDTRYTLLIYDQYRVHYQKIIILLIEVNNNNINGINIWGSQKGQELTTLAGNIKSASTLISTSNKHYISGQGRRNIRRVSILLVAAVRCYHAKYQYVLTKVIRDLFPRFRLPLWAFLDRPRVLSLVGVDYHVSLPLVQVVLDFHAPGESAVPGDAGNKTETVSRTIVSFRIKPFRIGLSAPSLPLTPNAMRIIKKYVSSFCLCDYWYLAYVQGGHEGQQDMWRTWHGARGVGHGAQDTPSAPQYAAYVQHTTHSSTTAFM